jgi:hypothetical protein
MDMDMSTIFRPGRSDVISFITYSLSAILLGILCNNAANFIDKSKLPLISTNVYVSAIAKVSVIGFILLFVQNNISPAFGSSWQNTSPGLIFSAIFFALQYNLMGTVQYIAKIWSM